MLTHVAATAEQVMAAVRRHWNLSGPLPIPRGDWLACPVCRAPRPQPRYWKWHRRPASATLRGRCDVSFKCVGCSHVFVFGVAVDEDTWTRCATQIGRMIHLREAQKMFQEESR